VRRNVLFITADQWRGDCLSSMRHPVVRTPTLDALAAEGTLFERHYANAVPCGPSRASLHTGMYLHNHRSGTNGTPLDLRFSNWALEARRVGYDPALFGYTHTAPDPRFAQPETLTTDEGLLPGITPVVDMATHCGPWRAWLSKLGYPLPEADDGSTYGQKRDGETGPEVPRPSLYDAAHTDTYFLVQSTLDYLARARREDGPGWFVHLSLRAPHPPWVAAAPYHARYPLATLPPPLRRRDPETEGALHPWLRDHLGRGRNQAHAEAIRHRLLQASYYGLMAEVDDNLARLFADIRAADEWEETLVVFTSDHGEQMGDHWLYGKAGFFEQSYHIPLLVRMPGRPGGVRVGAFTEHVDLMPTMLEWLGLEIPRQCDGASLGPWLAGGVPSTWRDAAHWEFDFRDPEVESALGLGMEECNLVVRRDATGKYVHFAGLRPLFFDLARDPSEFDDISGTSDGRARAADYAQQLLSWRLRHTDKTLSHMRVTRETGLIVREPGRTAALT
jgi:arylsulfatase A-like enzyme